MAHNQPFRELGYRLGLEKRPQPQAAQRALIGSALTAAGLTATGLGAWLYGRWHIPTEKLEITVPATVQSEHRLTLRDFDGEWKVQLIQDGFGPLYHRRYQVDIDHPTRGKEELLALMIREPNDFTPRELAYFAKMKGENGQMRVGDEYYIHIFGPWDGPVRATEVTPTSFSFVTLEHHLEAGEIQFRLVDHPDRKDAIRFEIRSWSRSKDVNVHLAYYWAGVAKIAQTMLWIFWSNRVRVVSGGRAVGPISVLTHTVPLDEQKEAQTLNPTYKQYTSRIDGYRAAKLNFDPSKRAEYLESAGWHIDNYQVGLPSEAPGKPVPGGSFESAKQVMQNYEFPDPGLVTGVFVPDDPFNERVMLIRARFLVFTFMFGVKISDVIDEERTDEKRGKAQVWGYSYRTLEGHFEMGEITFQVWKFEQTGEVEFRIHAYSKVGYISNPAYRIGFRIFGRGLQVRFSQTALVRMQQLVLARMFSTPEEQAKVETPEVKPLAEAPQELQDKVAESTPAEGK